MEAAVALRCCRRWSTARVAPRRVQAGPPRPAHRRRASTGSACARRRRIARARLCLARRGAAPAGKARGPCRFNREIAGGVGVRRTAVRFGRDADWRRRLETQTEGHAVWRGWRSTSVPRAWPSHSTSVTERIELRITRKLTTESTFSFYLCSISSTSVSRIGTRTCGHA